MTTLIRTLILEYDIIEVHYNHLLSKQPYLVRVFSYNHPLIELRLDREEVDDLYQTLKSKNLL